MEERARKNRKRGAAILYVLAAVLLALACWQVADHLILNFDLTAAELPDYAAETLGWKELVEKEVLDAAKAASGKFSLLLRACIRKM